MLYIYTGKSKHFIYVTGIISDGQEMLSDILKEYDDVWVEKPIVWYLEEKIPVRSPSSGVIFRLTFQG